MARHPRLPAPDDYPVSPIWVVRRWYPGLTIFLALTADTGGATEQG